MALLFLPQRNETVTDVEMIKTYLFERGVEFSQWKANCILSETDSQEKILAAYEHELRPFMQKNGFVSADVINVHPQTENLLAIREKFMKEHTHSEDEVRFFVDGEGKFWFHFESGEVVCLTCHQGDFLSVPKGAKHWFDLHPKYFVKAIRIFSNTEGWVANYTQSGIDSQFNP